jgi:hypothetical protein
MSEEVTKEKNKGGRPTIYTQAIADEICERLAHGETLRKMVLDDHMPPAGTIYRWLDSNESFRDQYAQARVRQADYYAEMIIDESFGAHDASIGRLRMDALKWASSKIAPKKYGDKIELESNNNQNLTLSFNIPNRGNEREIIELEDAQRLTLEQGEK